MRTVHYVDNTNVVNALHELDSLSTESNANVGGTTDLPEDDATSATWFSSALQPDF